MELSSSSSISSSSSVSLGPSFSLKNRQKPKLVRTKKSSRDTLKNSLDISSSAISWKNIKKLNSSYVSKSVQKFILCLDDEPESALRGYSYQKSERNIINKIIIKFFEETAKKNVRYTLELLQGSQGEIIRSLKKELIPTLTTCAQKEGKETLKLIKHFGYLCEEMIPVLKVCAYQNPDQVLKTIRGASANLFQNAEGFKLFMICISEKKGYQKLEYRTSFASLIKNFAPIDSELVLDLLGKKLSDDYFTDPNIFSLLEKCAPQNPTLVFELLEKALPIDIELVLERCVTNKGFCLKGEFKSALTKFYTEYLSKISKNGSSLHQLALLKVCSNIINGDYASESIAALFEYKQHLIDDSDKQKLTYLALMLSCQYYPLINGAADAETPELRAQAHENDSLLCAALKENNLWDSYIKNLIFFANQSLLAKSYYLQPLPL